MPPRFDHRYFIVLSAIFVQAIIIGSMFAFGVFFKSLEAELGWSRTLLSASSSLAFFVMGTLAIVAGRLNDRFGPRWVVSIAALIFSCGVSLMAIVQSPWQLFLFFGLMVGVGLAVHDVVTLSTVAGWFERRRGIMTGTVKVGTALGQVLLPVIATALIAAVGWRSAWMLLGIVGGVILIIAAQGLRAAPRSVVALEPSGEIAGIPFSGAVRGSAFWLLCAAQFMFFPALMTIPLHIVVHGGDLGMSNANAALVLSTIGGVSIAGRLFVGFAVDRIGGRRAMLICFGLLLASLLWIQLADRPWMLFVFAVVYGIAHGGFFTVVSPTVAEYFGMRAHGAIFGAILFCGAVAGASGPLLAGAAFDYTGSYSIAFITLAAMAGCGLLLTVILRPPLSTERPLSAAAA